jgi:hypothetical protein
MNNAFLKAVFMTIIGLSLVAILAGCQTTTQVDKIVAKQQINQFLNKWHHAAATANANDYFGGLNKDSIFIGTDATENWRKDAFYEWGKGYFEKGEAWDFTAIDRNIYFSDGGQLAWFDELLETTNLGICRGSGVLKMTQAGWKIEHYVLSVTSPNETVNKVTELNKPFEASIKAKFTNKK